MRFTPAFVAILFTCTGCPPNVQQHLAFRRARVAPDPIPARVGDIVRFEVFPPVARGTEWGLDCYGQVRFVDDPTASHLEWTADTKPIRLETIVTPWKPVRPQRSTARGWLWYGLSNIAVTESFDHELPIRRLEYREVAPVTVSSVFSLRPREPLLSSHRGARVTVTYLTPVERGTPYLPSVQAMMLDTDQKRLLYAEVRTNFGEYAKEPMGYEVSLSYVAELPGPIEVLVVERVGHGSYWGPFAVHRLVVDGPAPAVPTPVAAPNPSGAAPAP